jgi:hypothetical protein
MKEIINLLVISDYYGVSERVDIAKGKYKHPSNWKELKLFIKRIWKSKK